MNSKLIESHIEAAKALCQIKNEVKEFLGEKKNLNETKTRKFIKRRFSHYNLKTDKDCPIVAFNGNTSFVHYFPGKKSEKLTNESLIMVDMWAHKPNGVYADITWMFYYGRKPEHKVIEVFNAVIGARDACLSFIRDSIQDKKLPISNHCDAAVRDYLNKKQLGAYYFHSSGHSMTQRLVHGLKSNRGLSPKNSQKMKRMLPYTIEPGIYLAHLDEPFGVRSELDFYIDKNNQLIITSDIQKELDYILPKGQKRLDNY